MSNRLVFTIFFLIGIVAVSCLLVDQCTRKHTLIKQQSEIEKELGKPFPQQQKPNPPASGVTP